MKGATVYGRLGYKVIPLHSAVAGVCSCSKGSSCPSAGKHPRLNDWAGKASSDPEQIAEWIEQWPSGNVGVVTGGASGFWALDVDPGNGGPDTMARLVAEHGELPTTPRQRTGSGGDHHLFSNPEGFRVPNTAGELGPGLDTRGEGGQIVVAPSVSAKGPYSWIVPPWNTPVAPAPDWLIAMLRPDPSPEVSPRTFPPATPAVLDRARAALKRHGPAIQGQGGEKHTLKASFILLNDFALSKEQAWPPLLEWNDTCEPPWEHFELSEKFRPPKDPKRPFGCERARAELPIIRLTADEHEANAAAAEALAKHPDVFAQSGRLVKVNAGPPATLDGIAPAVIRHHLTQQVTFEKFNSRLNASVRATPTEPLINYLATPNTVPARPISTLLEAPSIRPDGSVLEAPGYDAATGAYLVAGCKVAPIPDRPTRVNAQTALKVLGVPFLDFPFETPADRSALLAFVLTMFIRTAIDGPMPLGLIDANVRGAGKSLIADLISLVATGRPAERVTFPVGNEEEQRKQTTALLQDGKQIVLYDNVSGAFGGAPLDQLLTSQVWIDRRLGVTQTLRLPNRTVWLATSNNAQLIGDLPRRVVYVRLVSPDARPEDRAGFKLSDPKGYTKANRGRLIEAALTILRAYQVAGRPTQGLKPFGSFESWSSLVREPLVWLGQPDPIARSQEFAAVSDTQGNALERLVAGIDQLCAGKFMPVGQILRELETDFDAHRELRAVLVDLCPVRGGERLPTSQAVGRLLTKYRQRRTLGGKALESRVDAYTKNHAWRVSETGVRGVSGCSFPTGLAIDHE